MAAHRKGAKCGGECRKQQKLKASFSTRGFAGVSVGMHLLCLHGCALFVLYTMHTIYIVVHSHVAISMCSETYCSAEPCMLSLLPPPCCGVVLRNLTGAHATAGRQPHWRPLTFSQDNIIFKKIANIYSCFNSKNVSDRRWDYLPLGLSVVGVVRHWGRLPLGCPLLGPSAVGAIYC